MYRGDARLQAWFDLALAHNQTLEAKEPGSKPRKKAAGGLSASAAAVQAAAVEAGASKASASKAGASKAGASKAGASKTGADDDSNAGGSKAGDADDGVSAPPKPRPSTTSGGAFARCVLHVVGSIPRGRVAAYGQVAALAGAARNARQVGHLLKEGLCVGGMPWHRVLGSSGKISLPEAAGGARQRRLLLAEGVSFRESGAVGAGTFWERTTPFFA